jgi:hypothetical protein
MGAATTKRRIVQHKSGGTDTIDWPEGGPDEPTSSPNIDTEDPEIAAKDDAVAARAAAVLDGTHKANQELVGNAYSGGAKPADERLTDAVGMARNAGTALGNFEGLRQRKIAADVAAAEANEALVREAEGRRVDLMAELDELNEILGVGQEAEEWRPPTAARQRAKRIRKPNVGQVDQSVLDKAMKTIEKAGADGVKSGDIQASLGLDRAGAAQVFAALTAGRAIRATGQARGMRYFAR